jgi:HEPN domain-containing protein
MRGNEAFHDQVCYHCQQSAEKFLKALLEEQAEPIPRTHILRDLLALLMSKYPSLGSFTRGLKFLTRFAVGIRYPGERASKRQAVSALRWAGRVRDRCRDLLGIRPPKRRRSK